MVPRPDDQCSIARSLGVLGERWTFLVLRESVLGTTKFADFKANLGVAPDVLTERLSTLVQFGVLEKVPYQSPGTRTRHEYRMTQSGDELRVVLSGLQQWGDKYLPRPQGPSILRRVKGTHEKVHVGYVDESGTEVATSDVEGIYVG